MRAFLLIADIGGYTRFMKVHRVNLAHAQYIVAQLLEAVIDGAGALKLSKLEGDAAFFYATVKSDADLQTVANRVGAIRRSFLERREELSVNRLCNCDSCMQAGQLNLKFVAHEGEVALQKIKHHTELAGVDVIFVHRLLKNSVPVTEYVLMSEPVHVHLEDSLKEHAQEISHELEGFDHSKQYWLDLVQVAPDLPPTIEPTFARKFFQWLKMTWRSIPYFLGLKKACDGFRNLTALGIPAPVIETTPSLLPPTLGRAKTETEE